MEGQVSAAYADIVFPVVRLQTVITQEQSLEPVLILAECADITTALSLTAITREMSVERQQVIRKGVSAVYADVIVAIPT